MIQVEGSGKRYRLGGSAGQACGYALRLSSVLQIVAVFQPLESKIGDVV